MSSKRLYFGLIATLVMGCLLLVATAYIAKNLLGKQAATLSKLKADTQTVQTAQQTLAKNKKDIATYSQLNQIARTIVPQDKDQAEAVREIVNLASSSGITKLTSITFPASTLGVGASTTSGTSTSPATAPTGLTQVTPVAGIPGVYDLQITVTQDATNRIPYSEFTSFLAKLEQNRRTAQVSSISIQPDPQRPSQVAFTLIIDEFIKP